MNAKCATRNGRAELHERYVRSLVAAWAAAGGLRDEDRDLLDRDMSVLPSEYAKQREVESLGYEAVSAVRQAANRYQRQLAEEASQRHHNETHT